MVAASYKAGLEFCSRHEQELQKVESEGTVELGRATSYVNQKSQLLISFPREHQHTGDMGSTRVYVTAWCTTESKSHCELIRFITMWTLTFSFPVKIHFSPESWSEDIPFSASPIKMCTAVWQHNLHTIGELLSQALCGPVSWAFPRCAFNPRLTSYLRG